MLPVLMPLTYSISNIARVFPKVPLIPISLSSSEGESFLLLCARGSLKHRQYVANSSPVYLGRALF